MKHRLTKEKINRLSSVPLWGAATSAHQVEGNTKNQWTQWEHANALKRSQTATEEFGGWLPAWKHVKDEALHHDNYRSAEAADHFNRYEEDFDILQKLNCNAYRFSIEWSRIEPEEGVWDQDAIEHYRKYIKAMKMRGIEPVMTLWHWTMPVWFSDKGAFKKRRNIRYFERFADKVMSELGDDIMHICILNEPNVYTVMGTISNRWPPQDRSPISFFRIYVNLVTAQKRVYKNIKKPHNNIGIAQAISYVKRVDSAPSSFVFAWIAHYGWNIWFLARIRKHTDFIGVNHYFTNFIGWKGEVQKHENRSDYGWHMAPYNIRYAVENIWKKFNIPIMITENGVADAKDQYREWWIKESLAGLADATESGVDVIGYMHWSLLDNFEWAEGFWPRFGLVKIDFKSQKRTVRPSAKVYSQLVAKIRLASKT